MQTKNAAKNATISLQSQVRVVSNLDPWVVVAYPNWISG